MRILTEIQLSRRHKSSDRPCKLHKLFWKKKEEKRTQKPPAQCPMMPLHRQEKAQNQKMQTNKQKNYFDTKILKEHIYRK
jgi:hypothetical protein